MADVLSFRDFISKGDTRVSWRIDGVIPPGLTVLAGPPKVGKGHLVISWACHIAAGKPWFGRPVEQGTVAYICSEGDAADLRKRLMASKVEYGLDDYLPLYLISQVFDLVGGGRGLARNEEEDGEDSSSEDEDDERTIEHLMHRLMDIDNRVDVLVVDTLAANFGNGHENDPKDMNRFLASLRRVREELGIRDVIVVHHTPRGRLEERGHTALRGASDVVLGLKPGLSLEQITASRYGAPMDPIPMELVRVDIGEAVRKAISERTFTESWTSLDRDLQEPYERVKEELKGGRLTQEEHNEQVRQLDHVTRQALLSRMTRVDFESVVIRPTAHGVNTKLPSRQANSRSARTVLRQNAAVQVLESSGRPLTVKEWSSASGVSYSTLERYADALEKRGIVQRNADGTYVARNVA